MIRYILEVIIWTIVLYIILEIIQKIIYHFIITPNEQQKIKTKTKSEIKKIK